MWSCSYLHSTLQSTCYNRHIGIGSSSRSVAFVYCHLIIVIPISGTHPPPHKRGWTISLLGNQFLIKSSRRVWWGLGPSTSVFVSDAPLGMVWWYQKRDPGPPL